MGGGQGGREGCGMMLQHMAIRWRSHFITRQWSSPWEVIELDQLRELPTEDSHAIA